MQVTRNVQRAGPKARKGSARASLSSSLYSPLFSSLLLMDRKLYARRPHMAHKKGTYAGLSSHHFPLSALPLFY